MPAPPTVVIDQLAQLCQGLIDSLGDTMVGIYLHGSAAMGCFNPKSSDLDILAVTKTAIPLPIKAELGRLLLHLSCQPIPVEIHILEMGGLHPWRYPPPYELHYSEPWRERFERDLSNRDWLKWDDHEHRDPDLGAHLKVTKARGVALCGAPIYQTLPDVPEADYLAAVKFDLDDAFKDIGQNPVYHTLNLCRSLAYMDSGQILSKAEGGFWALGRLPARLHPPIQTALELYQLNQSASVFSPAELGELTEFMKKNIQF